MRIRINSLETYFDKYVLPFVFIPWAGFGSVKRTVAATTATKYSLLIGLWVIVGTLIVWQALRLKTVILEDDVLYVGSYWKQVRVHLSEVMNIKGQSLLTRHWTLELRTPTEFGDKIRFIPKVRIVTPEGTKQTFAELQARIKHART